MSREPCYKCKFEPKPIDTEPCEYCSNTYLATGDHPNFGRAKPLTNTDRIRAMTDEELAEWINKHNCHTSLYGYDHKDAILDWLKQEATDD